MMLIGSYSTSGPLEAYLHDADTWALVQTFQIQRGHTSLRRDAEFWARDNGHTILEWDRSALQPKA